MSSTSSTDNSDEEITVVHTPKRTPPVPGRKPGRIVGSKFPGVGSHNAKRPKGAKDKQKRKTADRSSVVGKSRGHYNTAFKCGLVDE